MAMGDIAFNLLGSFFVILARAQTTATCRTPAKAANIEAAGH